MREVQRTEQTYSGGWVNDNRLTYKTDSLGRLQYEQREDWSGGSWVSQYDITQTYDKNGNRTAYTKNVSGSASDYGVTEHLGYTFGVLNDLTAISNSTDPRYSCAVTCDANNNITELDEKMTGVGAFPPFQDNFLYTYFEYDALNRMTKHKTKAYVSTGTAGWYWTERQYQYSAVGAILKTGWRHYLDGGSVPAFTSAEHVYDQQTGNYVQCESVASPHTYGTRWVWAGAQNGGYGNLFGPNSDTASQNAYALNAQGGAGIPNRRTFINPSTQGDKRELWGQGRPMGKDSNTAWSTGTVSAAQNINQNPVTSRLMFEGTVTSTDYSRITDMREKGRIGIYGTGLSYAGASPRVTSESIGRDLNPLGRGDGRAHVAGAMNLGRIIPALPLPTVRIGSGNSVNNWSLPELLPVINLVSAAQLIDWGCYHRWLPFAKKQVEGGGAIFTNWCKSSCPQCGISLNLYDFYVDPLGSAEAYCDCVWFHGCHCGGAETNVTEEWIPHSCLTCKGSPQCSNQPTWFSGVASAQSQSSSVGQCCQLACINPPPSKSKCESNPDNSGQGNLVAAAKRGLLNFDPTWQSCLEDAVHRFCKLEVADLNKLGITLEMFLKTLKCIMFGESGFNSQAVPPSWQKSSAEGLFMLQNDQVSGGAHSMCGKAWAAMPTKYKTGLCHGADYDKMRLTCPCYNIACGVRLFCRRYSFGKGVCDLKGTWVSMDDKNNLGYNCCVCYA